ncbi:MAG: N-acyl homoserine lactonase family protein [Thermodesulfobacteriota bacterium]
MRLFAFTCGWLTGPTGLFLDGEHGRLRVPVPAFLIEHPRGNVLFDTGMSPDVQRDPHARLGFLADVFAVEFQPGEEVAARLAARDVDPQRIGHVVLSHLHFDHVGGLSTIPNARVVVQRRDWEAGHDADLAASLTFARNDFDHGHDVQLVDGEHDLFGDGRVVCLPTYGHTPGHQSLRVRLDSGDVVLTADACYLRRTLEADHLPPQPWDREAMLASLRRLRALRDAGARVVYGHDPEAWSTVPSEIA